MRTVVLFMTLAACSGGAAPTPQTPWPQRPPIDAAPDAALPAPIARGGSCGPEHVCAEGLSCFAAPGGYCASACGATCNGACVTTAREGEQCLATCRRDADCRTAEGYFCDPQWHACAIPNTLAMVPRTCPGSAARDPAFGAVEPLATDGAFQQSPTAVIVNDGSLFVVASAPGSEITQLVDARVRAAEARRQDRRAAPAGGPPAASTPPQDRSRVFVEAAPEAAPSASLARDRKGILYAVWLDARSGPTVMFARSRDNGQTWTAPIVASEPADCALAAHDETARNDNTRRDDPRADGARDRRADDSRTLPFGEPACLEQAFIVVGPNSAARQSDVVYVGYSAAGALRVRASYDEGASFRAPATALSAVRASATVDASGKLHVIGVQGVPGVSGFGSANHAIVYATSSDAGRSFTRPSTLSRRDERLPYDLAVPRVVVDDKRRWLYVLYVRGGRDAVWDLALLASKDNARTWKRTRIGDECTIRMTPQLALDGLTGALHLAWYDSSGAPGRFAHASCTPGLAACSEPRAINDRPSAALATTRSSPGAVGDAALLVDTTRRTLHAVWAQPLDASGARIFHATATLPKR